MLSMTAMFLISLQGRASRQLLRRERADLAEFFHFLFTFAIRESTKGPRTSARGPQGEETKDSTVRSPPFSTVSKRTLYGL